MTIVEVGNDRPLVDVVFEFLDAGDPQRGTDGSAEQTAARNTFLLNPILPSLTHNALTKLHLMKSR